MTKLVKTGRPLFPLGTKVATPDAIALMEWYKIGPEMILAFHQAGNWGKMDKEDYASNDRAVLQGGRIMSVFNLAELSTANRSGSKNDVVWIITEHDRSVTTILLPENY